MVEPRFLEGLELGGEASIKVQLATLVGVSTKVELATLVGASTKVLATLVEASTKVQLATLDSKWGLAPRYTWLH